MRDYLDVVIRSKSTTRKTSHHTHYGYAVKGVAPRIRAQQLPEVSFFCAEAVQRCDGLTGSMARYARISDVLACSDYVSASTSPVMIAFEGDVVVVLERAPAADRLASTTPCRAFSSRPP